MTTFGEIEATAARRAGGEAALAAHLSRPRTAAQLRKVGDDRYLSQMSQRVFRAGLKHSVVDNKWPAFEEVFLGFDPRRVRAMSDEALEGLMAETRIIRHWGKIRSVRDNAATMCEVADEAGSFGAWLAGWPASDAVGLWDTLARRFSQMGGNSGPYFLRMVGWDTFILTDFVVRALVHWSLIDKPPKGKKDRALVQDVFNRLHDESGRPLTQISQILARSID